MILYRTVTSLSSLIDAVTRLSVAWFGQSPEERELWFRGCSSARHTLLPGQYRPPTPGTWALDAELFERFRARAKPFVASGMDDWDVYSLAQHHGLKTRLLDWSGSLLTAAYFSVSHSPDCESRSPRANDRTAKANAPTVWILDPGSLNKHTVDSDSVIATGGPQTSRYRPGLPVPRKTRRNRWPISILPAQSNSRIFSQQGLFTMHGWEARPIELLARLPHSGIRLMRITLEPAHVPAMREELQLIGHGPSTVFPDLDGVARDCNQYR